MPIVGWNEAVPSNTSKVGDAPPFFKSVLTAIETALGADLLYWPGAGGASIGSIGEMQLGGPRTFFAALSASSNSANGTLGGRVFIASDTSAAYCYDSAGSFRVGTPFHVEVSTSSAPNWTASVVSLQVANTASRATITFPSIFVINPVAWITPSNADAQVSLSTITTGGLVSRVTWLGSASTFTLTALAYARTTSVL